MIVFIEQGVLSKDLALSALETVIDVKQEIAGTTERVVVSMASIGMLRSVMQSLAAVTLLAPADREVSDLLPIETVTPNGDTSPSSDL